MKKLLLTLTLIVSVLGLSAQGFQVLYEGEAIESGHTFYVYGDGSAIGVDPGGELVIEFNVVALEDVSLMGEKVENNVIEGTSNSFCFGDDCYPSTVYVTPRPTFMGTGENKDFSMHYTAEEDYMTVLGMEQSMTYYIYPAEDTDNKFVINIIFKYSLDNVVDFASVEVFSSAYPVPASDFVNFDYSFPSSVSNAMIAVYNMMGQEVLRNDISGIEGKASINVSDLADGIYFYSLIVSGKTEKSGKIVVRR